MIQLGLMGSSGRMGQLISQLIHQEYSHQIQLSAQSRRGDSLIPLLDTEVVIDTSRPEAFEKLATLALQRMDSNPQKKGFLPAFVVGSTGWRPEGLEILNRLAQVTPVLISSNFSAGVFILRSILKDYSSLLIKLGYTPVIIEKHHQHKKDSPSGTALSLQKAIASSSNLEIQTHAIRAAEIVGEHEVSFHASGDQLSLEHRAHDRTIFARGAIEVALWLTQKRSQIQLGHVLQMEDYFTDLKEISK